MLGNASGSNIVSYSHVNTIRNIKMTVRIKKKKIICRKSNQSLGTSEDVHTVLSFSVSTFRACLLCLSSVRIYENSKGPLETLYNIPQQSYCKEVSFESSNLTQLN